jgi:peptidoglycan/LPS O-acetylase OafA/YrhL
MKQSAGSADSHLIGYRADIDGLRAVAVLAVVAFHAVKGVMPGGYNGVDIFFVLSGFLITGIIQRELDEGCFTVRRFYERRIRRILPALLVMMLAATAVAVAVLLPADLIGYGRSAIASLAFTANIYFWRDTDYFSRLAEEKPLLHIWSLGVEEQFYIVFPILMLALQRRPRVAFTVVIVSTAVSLAAAILAKKIGAAVPAFYLLPTRAWELGIGAAIALAPGWRIADSTASALLAVGAAIMILFGLWNPIPALNAFMLPTISAVAGTALLIVLGRDAGSWVNRCLASPVLAGIGLISYSLYLWHWPVLVFSRYYLVRDLSAAETVLAIALMFGLAFLSWRFVERPFRQRSMHMRDVLSWVGSGSAAILASVAVIVATGGLPHRLDAAAARINAAVGTNYRCPVSNYLAFGASRGCVLNLPSRDPGDATVVLIGNSHAQMYAPLLVGYLERTGRYGLLVPANRCLPMTDVNVSAGCMAIAQTNLAAVDALPHVRAAVVAMTWEDDRLLTPSGWVSGRAARQARLASLDRFIDHFRERGRAVALVGPIATPSWDIASGLSRQIAFHRPVSDPLFVSRGVFDTKHDEDLRHFQDRTDLVFVRPDLVQCRADRCDFLREGSSLFADSNHLAQDALPLFRPIFDSALDRLLERRPPWNSDARR